MRQQNFKLDWVIPESIIGLTHYHANVSQEDFAGLVQRGQYLTRDIHQEFHILIDNRKVAMSSLISLQQMQQAVPYMSHPYLKWVVVIKPKNLQLDTSTLPIEKSLHIQLKNVSSEQEALDFLHTIVPKEQWKDYDATFFQKEISMITACKTFTMKATSKQVWNVISDFGNIDRYHPQVRESHLLEGKTDGVGMARKCIFYNGGSAVETVSVWEPEVLLAVELSETSMPFKTASGFTQLRSCTNDTVEVTIGMTYKAKYGILGTIMGLAMKPVLKRMFQQVSDSLEYYINYGKKKQVDKLRKPI